jgi:hypothetical protein
MLVIAFTDTCAIIRLVKKDREREGEIERGV